MPGKQLQVIYLITELGPSDEGGYEVPALGLGHWEHEDSPESDRRDSDSPGLGDTE